MITANKLRSFLISISDIVPEATERDIHKLVLFLNECPTSADDFPIAMMQNVFIPRASGIDFGGFIELAVDEDRDYAIYGLIRTSKGMEYYIDVSSCYSSMEAAQSASKEIIDDIEVEIKQLEELHYGTD